MATNVSTLNAAAASRKNPRIAEKRLLLATTIAFPLIVLIGYFRTYYFSAFFDVPAVANKLVHAHGVIMSGWVLFFVLQTTLIRTRNVKVHMTTGMIGVALAALVVVVGFATAYDAQLVRGSAPPGANPHEFFILPVSDMILFIILFSTAVYLRKRPTEHKSLMFLTAIAFTPAALFRIPIVAPENATLFAFGVPALVAMGALIWHSLSHGRVNRVFAGGVALIVAAIPLRPLIATSDAWHSFVAWLAP
ncbi:MAG TPA: hypothetical protein VK918_04705 [Pyrinomonadaceae bacterium]|nr:hypothetical protein [Pyrinomonadaceae bacterium]